MTTEVCLTYYSVITKMTIPLQTAPEQVPQKLSWLNLIFLTPLTH